MKKIVILLTLMLGLGLTGSVSANHACGDTSDQFTSGGVSTHGCYAGGDPNPDFHKDEPTVQSAPAERGTDGGNRDVAQTTVEKYNDYISTGNQASNYQIDPKQHQGAADTNSDGQVKLNELINQPSGSGEGGDTSGQTIKPAGDNSETGCNYCGGVNQGGCDEQPSTRGFKCSFGCDPNLVFCKSTGSCQTACANKADEDYGPASSNPQAWAKLSGVPYDPNAKPVIDDKNYEYITYTCSRCSAGGKCETGSGENPSFSFGANFGACSQVDSRPKGSTGDWNALSLCSSSCSAEVGTMSVGGPPTEGGGPTPPPPPGGVVCGSLGKDVTAPQLNQTVTFTCNGSFSAVDPVYEFRHRVDGSGYTVVPGTANASKTAATAQVTINQAGTWEAQCRVCTDASKTSCTTWGQAQ